MDSKIVIKPSKNNIGNNIVINCLWWGFYIFLLIDSKIEDYPVKIKMSFWIIFGVFIFWLLSRVAIASLRTFEISEEGCQVSIMGYKKMYRWTQLETKRIVRYEYEKSKFSYKTCLELCKKKVKRLKLLPGSYCACVHPFTFIYVYFGEKEKLNFIEKEVASGVDSYVTEKSDFIAQLREWGVELEEITVKISGRK